MAIVSASEVRELEETADYLEGSRPNAARLIRRILPFVGSKGETTVSTATAASVLGVTPQTVRNWVDRGWLPAHRAHPLGRRRIPVQALLLGRDLDVGLNRHAAEGVTEDVIEATLLAIRDEGETAVQEPVGAEVGGRP